MKEVKNNQGLDQIFVNLKEDVLKKSTKAFSQRVDSILTYQGHLCVPYVDDLREIF